MKLKKKLSVGIILTLVLTYVIKVMRTRLYKYKIVLPFSQMLVF